MKMYDENGGYTPNDQVKGKKGKRRPPPKDPNGWGDAPVIPNDDVISDIDKPDMVEEDSGDATVRVELDKVIVDKACSVETEMFSKGTVRLRNIAGFFAVIITCINSGIYTWTIRDVVMTGGSWPDRTSLLIVMIGPIVVGWSFMNVNKVLGTLLGFKEMVMKVKNKFK